MRLRLSSGSARAARARRLALPAVGVCLALCGAGPARALEVVTMQKPYNAADPVIVDLRAFGKVDAVTSDLKAMVAYGDPVIIALRPNVEMGPAPSASQMAQFRLEHCGQAYTAYTLFLKQTAGAQVLPVYLRSVHRAMSLADWTKAGGALEVVWPKITATALSTAITRAAPTGLPTPPAGTRQLIHVMPAEGVSFTYNPGGGLTEFGAAIVKQLFTDLAPTAGPEVPKWAEAQQRLAQTVVPAVTMPPAANVQDPDALVPAAASPDKVEVTNVSIGARAVDATLWRDAKGRLFLWVKLRP